MEFLFDEWSRPGLAFMLFVSAVCALILPVFVIQGLKTRSPSSWLLSGLFLFIVLILLGTASALFGFAIPRQDRLFVALLLNAGALCLLFMPVLLLQNVQRAVRLLVLTWMMIGFSLIVLASGSVRFLDWIMGLVNDRDGLLAAALSLDRWELPAYALYGGLGLSVAAYVVARAPTEPEVLTDGMFDASLNGPSVTLRKVSRALAAATCVGVALYCFAWFSDAALGTAVTGLFQPVLAVGVAADAAAEAWEFYAEWIGFAFLIGALAIYSIGERNWGWLAGLGIFVTFYLAVANYFGLFDDWLGPFRAAWRAIGAMFG